jgi:hypothetical protein
VAWNLDPRFKTPENAQVLAFIERENPSAHDEASSALMDAARGLPDVAWYCPDPQAYAYVVLHTRARRIFAIAFGMSAVAFALPPEEVALATVAGGVADTSIGPGWVGWRIGADLSHWCKIAHDQASLAGGKPSTKRPR